MKIQMTRAEAEPQVGTGAGRDRGEVFQNAVPKAESFERTGVLGLAAVGIVAARDQNRGAVRRRHAYLMGENAGIERLGLRYQRADGAVGIEPMHADIARNVEGGEQILAGRI